MLGGGQQDPGGAGGLLQPGFAAALLLSPAGGAVGPPLTSQGRCFWSFGSVLIHCVIDL